MKALCAGCGTELPPHRKSCPVCHCLVFADRLKAIAAEAGAAVAAEDYPAARDLWRSALLLLPPESQQHASVAKRVDELSARVEREGPRPAPAAADPADAGAPLRPASGKRIKTVLAGVGSLGLLAWKFKFVVAFVATKGKLLLLGLTKGSTVFSMFLSLGVYWTAFGWWFALGLVVSIYVHEMGHVAALHRLGIRASAPMFIPGLGAMVRLKEYPASPREDARVGLAGPIYGFGFAVAVYAAYQLTGLPALAAIARVGAWINLFNLLPVWQLDGSRGMNALTTSQRWCVVGALGAAWLATAESLLILVGLVAAVRAATGKPPPEGDRRSFVEFLVLIGGLSLLSAADVPALP